MEEKQHAGSVQLSKKRKSNTAPNGANVQPSASNVGAKAYTDFLNAKDRWSRTALSWAVFRNRVVSLSACSVRDVMIVAFRTSSVHSRLSGCSQVVVGTRSQSAGNSSHGRKRQAKEGTIHRCSYRVLVPSQ